jgi:hypothetical protein
MRLKTHGARALAFALIVVGGMTLGASAALAAAPVNSAPPTIAGTPREGQTLTAANGTWQNNPTAYQYQWLRCDASGAGCGAIAAAIEKTYLLTGADVGHTIRVRVLAVNADGATAARSEPTARVTASGSPRNTDSPTISGVAKVGQTLTADEGTWTGAPSTYAYQWQRCDVDVALCFAVPGATAKTYPVTTGDLGYRLRVRVRATNSNGSGVALSGVTSVVQPATPITNLRPSLRIISVKFLGARVYARFRICDDAPKNLTIIQTDSRPNRASYTRRFSTLTPPRPCGVYTRNWLPAQRFRGPGRYTVTLSARDKSGRTSLPARKTFTLR